MLRTIKGLMLGLLMVGIVGVTATAALADSPHFIKTPQASIDSSTGSLTVTFKAAGLGNVPTASFTLSADATAVYGCFNHGSNHPQATNKEGPTSISTSGDFPVRNGQTTGSLTLEPLANTGLSCPGNQEARLISVSYENVTLSGQGLTYTFPGTFSATLISDTGPGKA
jgi:hypothetical protein